MAVIRSLCCDALVFLEVDVDVEVLPDDAMDNGVEVC